MSTMEPDEGAATGDERFDDDGAAEVPPEEQDTGGQEDRPVWQTPPSDESGQQERPVWQ